MLELQFESHEKSLSVRRFVVRERLGEPFEIHIEACSPHEDLSFHSLVGRGAAFRLHTGTRHHAQDCRFWSGVCSHIEQIRAESTGLSTYALRIVPRLWLLGFRKNYRVFQHQSAPDIIHALLTEWRIDATFRLDSAAFPRFPQRTQYAETDLAFVSRLAEEAGITLYFQEIDDASRLVLDDRPHSGEVRLGKPIRFADKPNDGVAHEYITRVRLAADVRSLGHSLRDVDFRRGPKHPLFSHAAGPDAVLGALEEFEYAPGLSLVETNARGDSPTADDRGASRHDERIAQGHVLRRMEAENAERQTVAYETNVPDLRPGVVFVMEGHPRSDLGTSAKLLVTSASIEGAVGEAWTYSGTAVFAADAYRPMRRTPKPTVHGIESAVVVGPTGEEIHTDEFGRVRVQFPWDREGKFDDSASAWVRVSQAAAGAGFGVTSIPRVGDEVLVAFVGGDPDQPVVVGRVHNGTHPVPFKLPENRAVTGIRTASTPRSGGYNEIRFDDTQGRELVHVQAERCLTKVVKGDETETTGQTRVIEVGRRLVLTTGQASIILDGPHVIIEGAGQIMVSGGPLEYDEPDAIENDRMNEEPPAEVRDGKEQYAEGISLNGSPAFRAKVRAALDKLMETPTGCGLLRKIRKTGKDVQFVETADPNGVCRADEPALAVKAPDGRAGRGSASTVAFNPDAAPRGAPAEAVLAYVLAHARMNAMGMRERGKTRGVKNADLVAIGLHPFPEGVSTENSLRREMGLPKRLHY